MSSNLKICSPVTLILLLFFCGLSWAGQTDLVWSTFLGGSNNDKGEGLALDGSGNIYLTGSTRSTEFPTTVGAVDTSYNEDTDAFVVKLSTTGDSLYYATYLGGSGGDRAFGIAVDDSGNAYVTGFTYSWNFPTTPGAFNTVHNSYPMWNDVFVVKLNPTGGAVLYGTYIGGQRSDGGYGIAIDDSGNAYVIGDTESIDFPATPEAFDTSYNDNRDILVVKLNPTGSALEYATYLGGNWYDYGEGIAIDDSGCAYVTGETQSEDFPVTLEAYDTTFNGGADGLAVKLSADGSVLEYASFLGGSSDDRGVDISVDDSNHVCLTGYTLSTGFPTTAGVFDRGHNGSRDVFVTRFNKTGGALEYSTFLGGGSDDRGASLLVDKSLCVYVTGRTTSSDFPVTIGAVDSTHNGDDDVFVAKLSPLGSVLEYATFLGGSEYDWGHGIGVDSSGSVIVTGITRSSDFPTTTESFDPIHGGWDDVFVAKLNLDVTPVLWESPPPALPGSCVLNQNYPNPFNAATEIPYAISKGIHVSLRVYNVMGAEVATLVDDHQAAGFYTVRWDAQDVASGVYFYVLTADDFKAVKKMVLLK